MGIKGLNKYFRENCCENSITSISIHEMKGKTIVIDTSIFMYKFLEQDKLLENMFKMVNSFLQNNITPIYIFDGKPETIKNSIVTKRIKKRNDAYEKMNNLQKELDSDNSKENEKMNEKIQRLKKQSTRVTMKHILDLKDGLKSLGVVCYDAVYEADGLCASFLRSNKAWACMSDDMDMFAYGCNVVIREWNIHTNKGKIHYTDKICKDIGIPIDHLSQVLILVGNDYVQNKPKISIQQAIDWYKSFIMDYSGHFYSWLVKNDHISKEAVFSLNNALDTYQYVDEIVKISKPKRNNDKVKQIFNFPLLF